MSQIVKLRRSSVSGQKPTNSNLQLGELALNTTDGKVYMAKSGSLGPSVEELISTNTVNTGSIYLTGDITGSIFTGSFKGDGSQLYNIPASGITGGISTDRIFSGSVSAIISPDKGLVINTNTTITGSLFTSGSNKLIGDTQLTGSLTISGSTTQIGNNTLLGTTRLSGSMHLTGALMMSIVNDPANLGFPTSETLLYVSASNNQTGQDLYIRQQDNKVKWKWFEGKLNTGILYGGALSYSGSTMYITKGTGIILEQRASATAEISPLTHYVEWNDITASCQHLTSSLVTYVGVDMSGSLYQQDNYFSVTQYRTTIPLGMFNHTNKSTITSVANDVITAYDDVNQTSNFIQAFGPLKLEGLTLQAQSGNLQLTIGAGQSFIYGGFYQQDPNNASHKITSPVVTPQIARIHRDGSGSFIVDNNNGNFYTTVETGHWDDGTGTLNTLGGNYSIQRVFFNPFTNRVHVYYGQYSYGNKTLAIQGLSTDPFVEAPYSSHQYVFVGYLIVKGGTSDLSDTNNNTIVQGGLFRNTVGSSGSSQVLATLHDLSDVDIATETNGDLLSYNSTTGKWTHGKSLTGDYQITGSLYTSGPLNIGTISILDPSNPEIVHIQNSGSNNGLVVKGNSNQYFQTYIANSNTGSSASTDLVIGSDNVTDTEHYLDLGINSSTYNAGYVGYENDSYLYAASDDLYIGTLGLSNRQSDVHIFTSNSWQNPQITISGSKQIGFNTQTIDPGRAYQFSGSAKFNNGARFEESIDVQYNVTAGNYVDTPMVYHGGDFELRTNGVINLNSIYGQAVNVTGSLNVAGTITAQEFHTTFVTSSVMYTSGSTKFGDTNDDTHQFTGSVKILGNETVKGNVILENNGQIQVHSATTNTLFGHFDGSTIYGPYYQMFGNNYSNVSQRGSSEFVFDTRNGGESGFNVASFDGSTWIRKFRVDNEGAKITGSLTVTNNVTASFFTGSFIGDANGLTNVPFYISGSNISGTTVGKTFTKLQFDDSTGLNVDETEPGTAFISIGSHFKDIFVSGSPILSATGSDAFEIIGLGGIHISSSTVDTNGNGYVKELTFDLTEISSSLDSRITALTGSTGGGISDGGYATLNQTTMAATWSFNHNLGQRYPIIQVFDSFGKVIIPSEIIMVDTSTTTITFPSAQSGKAVASLGTGPGGMTQFFTSAATWSLQHDLGADYPIVTIYDVNKNIIMPDRVTSIDSNNIEVGFTTPVAGHLNVAKGGHIISGSINFSNISTAGSGIVSSSIQVYNYGYATTGSNAFNGSQLIKNAKIDATCLTVSSGTSTIFTVSGYDGATFDYVVKNGVNRRAGTIVAIWDGSNSRFTETTTPDLGDTSNVSFTVSSAGALNAVVSSGTWTVEAMYRALNCS